MFRWLILPCIVVAIASFSQAQLAPELALKSMQPGPGLKVELFAAEPFLINPTAIDVDPFGRVWVAEAVNYRRKSFNRPMLRPEGDRIQILIDTNGDGQANEAKTFYQGEELYGPLSVLVLPQSDGKALRVLVAQSPDILEFWDRDGDLVADGPPTKWLSGFGGYDHDHGLHGLTLGPDGKLYFTVGDSGVTGLQSRDGHGRTWVSNNTDCQKGTIWRCDLDGNNLELVAHNFRNNYEAAVDSFGEIWCSDNDDDGHQQTRICFVMPGGNYGYGPRGPGQSHWHEEQPGIVHKVLRTGFGSPTGICFYEGNLLPRRYQGDLIHADAGPREIRHFKRIPKGAGYELEKTVLLTSSDTWFRPSDVCVAPDGSVFVADWYDPGVGGHGMGDWKLGRIYRLIPSEHQGYQVPKVNFQTKAGLLEGLQSPCGSTRAWAGEVIRSLDANDPRQPLDHLVEVPREQQADDQTSILQARLRWFAPDAVIHTMKNSKDAQASLAVLLLNAGHESESVRLQQAKQAQLPLLFRLLFSGPNRARVMSGNDLKLLQSMAQMPIKGLDKPFQRELALLVAELPASEASGMFYELAKQYDGNDHFFRAALNIACGTDPARRAALLADFETHFPVWNDRVADLVWELQPPVILAKLGQLLHGEQLTLSQKARLVDILAVSNEPSAGAVVLSLIRAQTPKPILDRAIDNLKLFLSTKWQSLKNDKQFSETVQRLLTDRESQRMGLELVIAANFTSATPAVVALANDIRTETPVKLMAYQTLGTIHTLDAVKTLATSMKTAEKTEELHALIVALGNQLDRQVTEPAKLALNELHELLHSHDAPIELQVRGLEALAASRLGTDYLLALKEKNELPELLVADAGRLLRNSPFQGQRNKAMILFPVVPKLDLKNLPSSATLASRAGDPSRGKALYQASQRNEAQCMKCHAVQGQGGNIGPDLSLIGKKGSKENLYDSILYPSKAIADQYVSWVVNTIDGQTISGLLIKETETELVVRDANGNDFKIATKDIEEKRKSLISLMPEGLASVWSEQELVDVVEYLMTLQANNSK